MDRINILKERYNKIRESIESTKNKYSIKTNVEIVAVTKYTSMEVVRDFLSLKTNSPLAESKAQSLRDRAGEIESANWHFIGRIQSNKIKYIVDYASLTHSVENINIVKEISEVASKKNKVVDILLEFNLSEEEQKGGATLENYKEFYEEASKLKNIKVKGVMGMASYTDNTLQVEREFESLREVFEKIKSEETNILSMGMSGDYLLAIKHGSTMVRIGSMLFDII